MLDVILYDLKDSSDATNIVTNIATSDAIYILPNTVRTKSTAARKANIVITEKNAVTINQKVKVKRKNIRDLAKYISSNPTTTATTNRQIVPFLSPLPHPDPTTQTTLSSFKTLLAVSAPNIIIAAITRFFIL